MEALFSRFQRLLSDTNTDFLRYLHDKIIWTDRMIAIVGARGVGKTTMMLQRIKLHHNISDTLYVTADDMYFADHKLLDLAEQFVKMGGKYLFIDEIHRYANWSKELKLIYDYLPHLQVVFTGSSMLDIYRGSDDLSRRVQLYTLHGMSFREYLNLRYYLQLQPLSLDDVLHHNVAFDGVDYPLAAFKDYLNNGYYPFSREVGLYHERLRQIVQLILDVDIPQFANMNAATSQKLKQLLAIIAKSVPFKPNYSKIASIMGVSRDVLPDYILYMERAGLVNRLFTATTGIRELGKVAKIYLNNTNLAYALGGSNTDIGNIRETFFFNQLSVKADVRESPVSDFLVDGFTFEIGGRKKGGKQIADTDNAYIVKDDIEFGFANTIPLHHFGMLY
ncbi:MAG: AAA family ATPase [Sodaliphilus sp.]|nr:AAA family ATPase [Sodaliphilus sp.]